MDLSNCDWGVELFTWNEKIEPVGQFNHAVSLLAINNIW